MTAFDLESVYDSEISPLMTRIIEICKRTNMPVLASFCFKHDDEDTSLCTTCIPAKPDEWLPDSLNNARIELLRKPSVMAFTITTEKK